MAATLEREIKLHFDGPAAARAAVLAAGGTPLRDRRLQDDYLLDTADERLRRRGSVLRVRIEPGRSFLTLKGPAQPSAMKVREELETIVADGTLMLRLLEKLGFHVWFRYQKYREELALDDVIVAVDETPVGTYVEIEGNEGGIVMATEALGRRPSDYVLDSYRGLFVRHCQERGLAVTNMLFADNYASMQALVLAAGLGTRLRPLTDVCAKPALPVAGQPLIRRIVRWLAAHDVKDLVVNLHYLPQTITAVLGDGSDLSVRVRYSWEQPQILGSAGGPRLALDIIGDDTFIIVNGDTLTDLNLGALVDAHRRSDALVTLALVQNQEPQKYGGVIMKDDGTVTGFTPRGPAAKGSCHFIGVQVVQAEAFRQLSAGHPAQSIGGLYDSLIAARPGSIRGHVSDAAFWDIGTPEDYGRTSAEFSERERQ